MAKRPCGTYAAAQRHYRNGEQPCEACRKAMQEYRKKARSDEAKERDRVMRRVRSRALWELSRKHQDEYEALIYKHALVAEIQGELR